MNGSTEVELWRELGKHGGELNDMDARMEHYDDRLREINNRRFVYFALGGVLGFMFGIYCTVKALHPAPEPEAANVTQQSAPSVLPKRGYAQSATPEVDKDRTCYVTWPMAKALGVTWSQWMGLEALADDLPFKILPINRRS